MAAPTAYRFGPFELDLESYRLRQGASDISLQPKALEVLRCLVERPGALHTKDELFAAVWPDVAVTDNALTQVISDIRQALADKAGAPCYLETVARRGYRFIAAVEKLPRAEPASGAASTGSTPVLPSMAVLDFENLGGDPEMEWLGAGVAETVLGDLRASGRYRIIDRSALRERTPSTRERLDAARAAGADCAVTGSIQRAGDRLRLNARVIDAASGEVRAEARADGWLADVFQLQDAVTRELGRALGLPPRARTHRTRQTSNLEAYRAAVEGQLLLESLDAGALPDAEARFTRAIMLDPEYAAAHIGLANVRCCRFERMRHRLDAPAAMLLRALEDARRGVELDPGYAEAHATLAFVLTSAGHRSDAKREALMAVSLEPDQWLHHFRLGNAAWGGERVAALRRALELFPAFPFAHFQLAMVDVARGLLDRADATIVEGLAIQSQEGAPRRFPGRGLHWLSGLIALARNDPRAALGAFGRELSSDAHHLYGAEFATAARWGTGFALAALGEYVAASAAFDVAVPDDGSGRAALGLAAALRHSGPEARALEALAQADHISDSMRAIGRADQAQLVDAAKRLVEGDAEAAVQIVERVLEREPAGPFGWLLPIDPAFAPLRESGLLRPALETLAKRAG